MSKRRDFALLAVALAACGSPTTTPKPPPAQGDGAAHTIRMIEVAPGVALEVLDFGGTGEPIVLLAGLGNTAHVFDDFAPALTDHHRVIAITRRGFGSSGTSATGHEVATRVADDLAVLDALKLTKVILGGHSIAGDELSEMGIGHPDRLSALIYLDASQDHIAVGKLLASAPPDIDVPPPPDAMASVKSFADWFARQQGIAIPHGEHLARLDLGPKGGIRGFKGDDKAGPAIIAGTKAFDLSKITTGSLVFLATEATIESAGLRGLDAKKYAEVERWWPSVVALDAATVADNRTNFHAAKVVEIPHAHHYVFISHRDRVLEEIRAFLAK